jgi:short-subunit dehydrogenase
MIPSERRKVIVITGASSGLGAGMAREFAKRGADLALCARRLDQLEALKAEIESSGSGARIEIARLDVTDHAAVFACFRSFRDAFGRLDRVIVNAGIGAGAPIGKGGFARNLDIVATNFTAALAQSEAALEIFREQGAGHLAIISSMSALRGLRGGLTVYAASKAGVAALAEGMRAEFLRKPAIKVSTIYPGYIRTEMNENAPKSQTPFIIDAERGCRLLADAIEKEQADAYVPFWPWAPLGFFMRRLPLSIVARMT